MKKSFSRILSIFAVLLVMGMTVCAADAGDIKKNTVLQTNSDVELHEEPDAASTVTATLPGGTPVIIREDAADGWCKVSYKEDAGYVQISFLGTLGSQVISDSQNVTADSPNVEADNQDVADDSPNVENDRQSGTADSQNVETGNQNETDDSQNMTADGQSATEAETEQDQGAAAAAQEDKAVPENDNALDNEFKRIEEAGILAYEEAENAKNQAASERTWGIVIAVLVIAIFAVGITTTVINNKGKKK